MFNAHWWNTPGKKKKKQRKLAMIVPFSCLKIKNKDVTPPLTT